MKSRREPMSVARELFEQRFAEAEVLLVAGSVMRGESTEYSDLDIVVVYSQIEFAYRESLTFGGWNVEVFVHDTETMAYFFDLDASKGVPALAHMISEGQLASGNASLAGALRAVAERHLAKGPPSLTAKEVEGRRYLMTDFVDDLRAPRSIAEARATGASLYPALADYWLRSQNRWSASGKAIPGALERMGGDSRERFVTAFDELFVHGRVEPVIALVESILAPVGGFYFEGFRMDAPADWRKPSQPTKTD